MSQDGIPPLQISAHWATLTDHLVELVDLVPAGKMNWMPNPEMWNFRGIFLHIVAARHHWLANSVRDGEESPDYVREGQDREGLKRQLRLSWERLERFLCDSEKLAAVYEPAPFDPGYFGDPPCFDGHYIAYHRLVHDVHHRADILHYLSLLGVDLPPERRRRPL